MTQRAIQESHNDPYQANKNHWHTLTYTHLTKEPSSKSAHRSLEVARDKIDKHRNLQTAAFQKGDHKEVEHHAKHMEMYKGVHDGILSGMKKAGHNSNHKPFKKLNESEKYIEEAKKFKKAGNEHYREILRKTGHSEEEIRQILKESAIPDKPALNAPHQAKINVSFQRLNAAHQKLRKATQAHSSAKSPGDRAKAIKDLEDAKREHIKAKNDHDSLKRINESVDSELELHQLIEGTSLLNERWHEDYHDRTYKVSMKAKPHNLKKGADILKKNMKHHTAQANLHARKAHEIAAKHNVDSYHDISDENDRKTALHHAAKSEHHLRKQAGHFWAHQGLKKAAHQRGLLKPDAEKGHLADFKESECLIEEKIGEDKQSKLNRIRHKLKMKDARNYGKDTGTLKSIAYGLVPANKAAELAAKRSKESEQHTKNYNNRLNKTHAYRAKHDLTLESEYADHPIFKRGQALGSASSKEKRERLLGKIDSLRSKAADSAKKSSAKILSHADAQGILPSHGQNKELDKARQQNILATKRDDRLRLLHKGISSVNESEHPAFHQGAKIAKALNHESKIRLLKARALRKSGEYSEIAKKHNNDMKKLADHKKAAEPRYAHHAHMADHYNQLANKYRAFAAGVEKHSNKSINESKDYHIVDNHTGDIISSHKAAKGNWGTHPPQHAEKKLNDLNTKHFYENPEKNHEGRYTILHKDEYSRRMKLGLFNKK